MNKKFGINAIVDFDQPSTLNIKTLPFGYGVDSCSWNNGDMYTNAVGPDD
jgi:hypothetical protein